MKTIGDGERREREVLFGGTEGMAKAVISRSDPAIALRDTKHPIKSKPYMKLAVKVMCYECNGRENWRNRTKECVIPACPLYKIRPYQ